MKRRTLFGQIFPAFLFITLLSIVLVTWYATSALGDFYRDRTREELILKADLVEARFTEALRINDYQQVDNLCKQIASKTPMRLTVILPTGRVVGDSEEDPAQMEDHADRPEIINALLNGQGSSVRFSDTLQRDMMYVAKSMKDQNMVAGVLRTSVSLDFISLELQTIHRKIMLVAFLSAILAGFLSLWVSRRISRPLATLQKGAERFSRGDLKHPLVVPNSQEIGALTESINKMASDLDDRIRTTVRQRNELEAVLGSMAEGILAIDAEQSVLNLNQAAAQILGVEMEGSRNKPLEEIIRNVEVHDLVQNTIRSEKPCETETIFRGNQDSVIHLRAAPLRDAKKENVGVLVVMNDLTHIRQLENMRRDFVANVSHELKTPITSIKGYVETLLDGAAENVEDLNKFLKIIRRQANRLHTIIDDLLVLSQIEEDGVKGQVVLHTEPLLPILQDAVDLCQAAAEEKNTRVHLSCDENIQARVVCNLLKEACVNLINNAIKYGDPGGEVCIEAVMEENEIVINVIDSGPGISEEHLPRIFERFYRVDKSRSRELGGTGLGLAIVKHIAQVHRGKVTVQSESGKGTVFSICLPAR